MLQVCKVQQYPFTDDQAVMQADWELYIQVHFRSAVLESEHAFSVSLQLQMMDPGAHLACTSALDRRQEIVGDVLREQTPKQLYVVRGKLYELLTNCIPPEVIFRHLTFELLRKLDDELRHKVWRCKVPVLLPNRHACTALLDST